MTVGSWNPDADQSSTPAIDTQMLQQFVSLGLNDRLENLGAELPPDTIAQQAFLMRLEGDSWQAAAESLGNGEIWQLIRFFTLAEEQLAGWQAGAKSPVIWLNKVLKRRGAPLDREQLTWIRTHSDNRFLPNGPL